MNRLEDIGAADGWRCWLCDEPVDPDMSVNDPRGPSVDMIITKAKSKAKGGRSVVGENRLAHRACNTKKGAVAPVVEWNAELFVVDPAPILGTLERLARKGGREVMARCPNEADGDAAACWLADRLSRLAPALAVETAVEPGGGQFLLVLRTR